MTLQPHQARVVAELDELLDRLGKLQTFLVGPLFDGLPAAEQGRLGLQVNIMSAYAGVLQQRILAFT